MPTKSNTHAINTNDFDKIRELYADQAREEAAQFERMQRRYQIIQGVLIGVFFIGILLSTAMIIGD